MIGKVYLVGAGPGDPDLLTVWALRVLRQADVVLHDELVPATILSLAASNAEIVNAGKRCGKKSITQVEINAGMIERARRGLTVVRLKGGDPSIFGRAGEEIEALREAGVDFEIIPGVTAACAAAAAAGISLTHRDLASGVVLLTGSRAANQSPCEDAGTQPMGQATVSQSPLDKTVVVYMPGQHHDDLQARLRAAGIPEETPCLLVSAAHTERQRISRTTVGGFAKAPLLAAPAILIAGRVAGLARDPSSPWFRTLAATESACRFDRGHELTVRVPFDD